MGELLGACAACAGADPAGFTAWQGWGCAALQVVYVATARAYAGSGCARLEARAAAFLEALQEERTWGEGGMGEAEGAHRAAREASELASEPVIPLEPFALLVNALCVQRAAAAFARAFSCFSPPSFTLPLLAIQDVGGEAWHCVVARGVGGAAVRGRGPRGGRVCASARERGGQGCGAQGH